MNKKAFTLIELLVVIAIIALLVSILLPSLKKAQDLAKSVVCTSNLHNLGMAMSLYANDYDSSYPLGLTCDSEGWHGWDKELLPYDTEVEQIFHTYVPGEEIVKVTLGSALCPSHVNHPRRSQCSFTDFAFNCSVFKGAYNTSTNVPPLKLSDIKDTANTFLMVDGSDSLAMNLSVGIYSMVHLADGVFNVGVVHNGNECANMLFAGGNAETRFFPDEVLDVAYDPENIVVMYK